jgi:hypothetical protein
LGITIFKALAIWAYLVVGSGIGIAIFELPRVLRLLVDTILAEGSYQGIVTTIL